MGEAMRRRELATATLDALEASIAEAKALAAAGGAAGDAGEPERKRVALALFRAAKRIAADADTREPLFSYTTHRSRARHLGAEAEMVARTIAQTFTEWPGAAKVEPPPVPLLTRGKRR